MVRLTHSHTKDLTKCRALQGYLGLYRSASSPPGVVAPGVWHTDGECPPVGELAH